MSVDHRDGELTIGMMILADVAEVEDRTRIQRGEEENAGENDEYAECEERV